MEKRTAIVIGAGIVGLATARALGQAGFSVKVFERNAKAIGASIRNFGMVWPIGQPMGKLYKRAMRSREIWMQISKITGIWSHACGSLHLAYSLEEWQVLKELAEIFKLEGRDVQLYSAEKIQAEYEYVQLNNLYGGLFSADELLVDPREALNQIPNYLSEQFGIEFYWNNCVNKIEDKVVYIGNKAAYSAEIIVVCSGMDFETLYPEVFESATITKCKLQMLRSVIQPNDFKLRTAICGGLSLLHYTSFKAAPSLATLHKKLKTEMDIYLSNGIHVMAAQNGINQITIGDSHEYGQSFDPFDKSYINQLILDYLQGILKIPNQAIEETWHGIYPKMTNGDTEMCLSPEPGVFIINGLGGAGMTLSFGLAEELIGEIIGK